MADFKWDDFPKDGAETFDWDAHPLDSPAQKENKFNAAQSAVMHGLQGATGGFMDEIQGLGEAAGRMVGVKGAGGPMKDMGLAEGGPTLDWNTLRDAYRAARDQERASLKTQSEEHPVASGLADVGGAIASPINKLAQGASLARGGAMIGAASGLGRSESEDLAGMVEDAGQGAGIGLASGAGLQGMGKLGSVAKNTVDDIATAPLGAEGERGLVAQGMDLVHRAGKAGNAFADDLIGKLTPDLGNDAANALMKGAQKIGRYGVAGKVQGGLDTLEQAPKVAQWAAQKASPMLEKAGQKVGPYAEGLAKRSPQVFEHLMGKMGNQAVAEKKPFDQEQIIQKTQGTKYAQALQSAAQRGGQAVGATHFLLQSKDPEYRKLTLDEDVQDGAGG